MDYYYHHEPSSPDENVIIDTPHTVLVFVPGNPGLIEWYLSFFVQLVERLGPGFAARGVANAGHSLHPEHVHSEDDARCTDIPWTVEGQSLHKEAYVDLLMQEFETTSKVRGVAQAPQFLFVCHSIGTFFAQQLLMRRVDFPTRLLIGLMPFIRMNAPWDKQYILETLAAHPDATIRAHEFLSRLLSKLPKSWLNCAMRYSVPDPEARYTAVQLITQPHFIPNFFHLGLEEIRDVPETVHAGPLRRCPTALLLAGNDHWAPKEHLKDMQCLRDRNMLPETVTWEYRPELRHDFVVDKEQVVVALDFCEKHIRQIMQRSRL